MSDLPSKVIAVTGGASGIGLATVKTLCKSKSIVIVGDLAPDASPGLQEVISATDLVTYRQLDVSSRESAHAFVVGIVKEHGRLDGLVNNAGICPNEGEMASDEVFDKIMAVNLKGVWHMGTEAILQMNRQETKGVIVNTASDGALKGIPGIPAYVASKHAVLGLTRTWCKEWTPKGIRVNAVAPGVTKTPMVAAIQSRHDVGAENTKAWLANIPMGRFGEPFEIASVIAFLLGSESSFMSGQCVRVGGGEGE